MKKNITINLCGRLFSIDEDAYELLKNYIETLRNYFRRQEGDEEIANDIEQRVSELFSDIIASGAEAITIEHVQDIIHRIGELKDITGGEEESRKSSVGESVDDFLHSMNGHTSSWIDGLKKRHFYLDSRDKVVAGVLSGCANYFGGSALVWRLCYLLLFFIPFIPFVSHGALVILYIIVAILAPSLRTPEDCLRMKGVEVTPQTLGDEVTSFASHTATVATAQQSKANGCLSAFFSVVGVIAMAILALFGVTLIVPFAVFFCMFVAFLFAPEPMLLGMWGHEALEAFTGHSMEFWILGFCVLVVCLIPAYCAFHCLLKMLGKVQPMGYKQRILWLVLWLCSIAGITATGLKIAGYTCMTALL